MTPREKYNLWKTDNYPSPISWIMDEFQVDKDTAIDIWGSFYSNAGTNEYVKDFNDYFNKLYMQRSFKNIFNELINE